MKTMNITDFKAHALNVISNVSRMHERVLITKRGKPVAEVVPFRSLATHTVPGKLASALVFEHDIVSPIDEVEWEVTT